MKINLSKSSRSSLHKWINADSRLVRPTKHRISHLLLQSRVVSVKRHPPERIVTVRVHHPHRRTHGWLLRNHERTLLLLDHRKSWVRTRVGIISNIVLLFSVSLDFLLRNRSNNFNRVVILPTSRFSRDHRELFYMRILKHLGQFDYVPIKLWIFDVSLVLMRNDMLRKFKVTSIYSW